MPSRARLDEFIATVDHDELSCGRFGSPRCEEQSDEAIQT